MSQKTLEIKFYYFEDCPSHETALSRLNQILDEEQAERHLEIVQVETHEDAERLNFPGSPTILINGTDIDPNVSELQAALTCRTYRLEDGRITPLPSENMIRTAVQKALAI